MEEKSLLTAMLEFYYYIMNKRKNKNLFTGNQYKISHVNRYYVIKQYNDINRSVDQEICSIKSNSQLLRGVSMHF